MIPIDLKDWWIWGYWVSPLMYGQNALVANEFLGKQWRQDLPGNTETLGVKIIKSRGFFAESYWYWIGAGALFGFIFLFNAVFTLALAHLNPIGKSQAVLSEETLNEQSVNRTGKVLEMSPRGQNSRRSSSMRIESTQVSDQNKKRGMVLPFQPLSITFEDIIYSVNRPQEMKAQGVTENRFVSAWRLALLSIAVIPGIALAGGLYAYTLTGLTSKSRESYSNAGIIAEQAVAQVRTVYSYVGESKTLNAYSDAISETLKLGYKAGIAKGLGIGCTYGIACMLWALFSGMLEFSSGTDRQMEERRSQLFSLPLLVA